MADPAYLQRLETLKKRLEVVDKEIKDAQTALKTTEGEPCERPQDAVLLAQRDRLVNDLQRLYARQKNLEDSLIGGITFVPAPHRGAAAGPGVSVLTAVAISESPSTLGADSQWHRYAYAPAPAERDAAVPSSSKAAFFGFRLRASPPAVVPPQLVSPAYSHILDAAAAPAAPPASWGPAETQLLGTVRRLLALGSGLYPAEEEEELRMGFLAWHSTDLLAGQLTLGSSTSTTLSAAPDGTLTSRCRTGGEAFAVALLGCKSAVGAGDPLVRALRHYQMYYGDGTRWAERATYRCDPMPALLLLLEGPRLSIHAAWTIYQNRVGYAPLTPSYYLANEVVSDNSNVWKLMAVLSAYRRAVKALDDGYALRGQLLGGALGMERAASLRTAAHTTGVAMDAHTPAAGGAGGVRPCTLPYGLLDEALGLSAIAFRGPGLMYEALQQVAAGGEERAVLVKFVRARYGAAVHKAWHAAGLAPALYGVHSPVGGGSGGPAQYLMVVMELLRPADGWMPLRQALELAAAVDSSSRAAGGGLGGAAAALQDAVRQALHRAHAVPVEQSAAAELVPTAAAAAGGGAAAHVGGGGGGGGSHVGGGGRKGKAVHGDVRLPNILVRPAVVAAGAAADGGGGGVASSSAASGAGGTAAAAAETTGAWHVRFIDFDWRGSRATRPPGTLCCCRPSSGGRRALRPGPRCVSSTTQSCWSWSWPGPARDENGEGVGILLAWTAVLQAGSGTTGVG